MHTSSSSIRSLPYLGWKVGQAKNVFGREGGLQTETSQEGYFPGPPTLRQSPMWFVERLRTARLLMTRPEYGRETAHGESSSWVPQLIEDVVVIVIIVIFLMVDACLRCALDEATPASCLM